MCIFCLDRVVAVGCWLSLGEIGCKEARVPKTSLGLLWSLAHWLILTMICLQTYHLVHKLEWNLKKCDTNCKWKTSNFKVKVAPAWNTKIYSFYFDGKWFRFLVCKYLVSVCRQTGIFHVNYGQLQQFFIILEIVTVTCNRWWPLCVRDGTAGVAL